MVVVTTRPRRKPNTTSNAFGVERKDSLTLVTSWIASAAHQTGQRPPTGYTAVDLADTGTGTCSQRWVTGARRDRLPQELWLADWFAVDCPREINSRRVFRRHVDWTGPRAEDTLSGAVSQSVHYPFFPPLPGRPIARNSADSTSRCADCSRSCRSWDSRLARAA